MKREDYLSWDEYFMGIALLSAERSKDPNTQVGSCIVNDENKIVSVGYNGAPTKFSDDIMPWDREGDFVNTKYAYVCHSELNALLNYRGNNNDFVGARIYVHYFPCNECAKAIIQSGIKEVIFYHTYDYDHHSDEMEASKRMLDECGVTYRQYQKQGKDIKLEL